MSAKEYEIWYAKHLEMLAVFHNVKQQLLGINAPKRYNSVVK